MGNELSLPREVSISDITLRDGLQAEQKCMHTEGKIFIINSLVNAGFRELEVTAFAPPKYQPQFRDAEKVLASLQDKNDVTYSCVTMGRIATERAFEAKKNGYRVDRILVAILPANERLNKIVIGMNYSDTWEWIADTVKKARELGIKVNAVLTGIFSPPAKEDGGVNTMERALEFCGRLLEMGVDDIEHPDHLGEATPEKTYEYFRKVMERFPDPKLHVFHVHDSRAMGLACYLASMQAGITRFETTLGGLGGWPANFVDGIPVSGLKGLVEVSRHPGLVSTEDFLIMLDGMGIETGLDVEKVLELGRIVEKMVGRQLWSLCLGTEERPGSGRVQKEFQEELKTEKR